MISTGPNVFFIYVSDIMEGIISYISLSADDAKVMIIGEDEECNRLHEDIEKHYSWIGEWEVEFC